MEYWSCHHSMSFKAGRSFRVTLLVLVASIMVVAARRSILRALGNALVVDELIAAADIVVVPHWTGEAGALDAADLIRSGFASRALVVGRPLSAAQQELTRRGIFFVDEASNQ